MSAKILFVDDDPNILAGYLRQLHNLFTIEVAQSGEEALTKIGKDGDYAVIVTDMRMPGMDGVEFLKQVSKAAPHTVRMVLTGYADQQAMTDALNEGHVYRFLTKPCAPEVMAEALKAALAQYRFFVAEKELMEKTLIGSISILVDLLSISEPQMFERGKRLRDNVHKVADIVGYRNHWELEMAALLSQIGSLTLPPEILLKERKRLPLSPAEQQVVARVPESGYNLLTRIPRLETVAQIVRYQQKHYNGEGAPADAVAGEAIPLGSRILKILGDLTDQETDGASHSIAFRQLHSRKGWYDPTLLEALSAHYLAPPATPQGKVSQGTVKPVRIIHGPVTGERRSVAIAFGELIIGDVLTADALSTDGALLLSAGIRITEALLETMHNCVRFKGVREPLYVAATVSDSHIDQAA
jgi:response regulator RpfG family c-di-GMP phosphodiesterase